MHLTNTEYCVSSGLPQNWDNLSRVFPKYETKPDFFERILGETNRTDLFVVRVGPLVEFSRGVMNVAENLA
jgi:hypothetical protein